jgi:hypothetical protein
MSRVWSTCLRMPTTHPGRHRPARPAHHHRRPRALASFTKQWRVFRDAVDEILNEGSQE